jgi:hypothetical protein
MALSHWESGSPCTLLMCIEEHLSSLLSDGKLPDGLNSSCRHRFCFIPVVDMFHLLYFGICFQ